MKNPLVSIVIRSKNEERTIGKLFEKLKEQTYTNTEVILVDNESIDKTVEVAKKHKVNKIISVKNSEFFHPHSTNIGIKQARGEYVVLTNGHCFPMSDTWIEDGLKSFTDLQVAGIDGHYFSGSNATTWQKDQEKLWKEVKQERLEGEHISTTNAMIRNSLWQEYRFDESLPECEDYDWSQEMRSRGYKIVKDPRFNVIHDHPLTESQWEGRVKVWDKLCAMIDKRKRPFKQN